MSFFEQMKVVQDHADNLISTENGAIGYRSTGKALLDLNFSVSSLRGANKEEIVGRFKEAIKEDPDLALRWLFFLRDVRGGLGERRTFRVIFDWLCEQHFTLAVNLVAAMLEDEYMIPYYGRWDDLIRLFETLPDTVTSVIADQLNRDLENYRKNQPISLLAKWLPSINTSSKATREQATAIAARLKLTPRQYRVMLSTLRKHLQVVETKMSANRWSEIDYEAVPSKANLNYANAFMKHDEDRRTDYLQKLSNGEVKINASAAYPHEIVKHISNPTLFNGTVKEGVEAEPYEAMWKALIQSSKSAKQKVLVVADGSGSMTIPIPNSNTTALCIANSLALYFAEIIPGDFHGKYITFSSHPQLVDLNCYNTLSSKLIEMLKYNEMADTNIEGVFDLILETAVKNHTTASEMPDTVLVISDMEFNDCVRSSDGRNAYLQPTLFESIAAKYEQQGYTLPRLVFWNVNSRSMAIPVIENTQGVALVSGFSPNIMDMVMSQELDPYKCLVKTLMATRYDPVADIYEQCKFTKKSWRI